MKRKAAARRRLEAFAKWSDEAIRIPGTNTRIGLEPLIGVIPGVGDAAGMIVAAYVPLEAWYLGAPKRLLGRMAVTIAADAVFGAMPVLGDLFDFTFKANRRNVNALTAWLDGEARRDR